MAYRLAFGVSTIAYLALPTGFRVAGEPEWSADPPGVVDLTPGPGGHSCTVRPTGQDVGNVQLRAVAASEDGGEDVEATTDVEVTGEPGERSGARIAFSGTTANPLYGRDGGILRGRSASEPDDPGTRGSRALGQRSMPGGTFVAAGSDVDAAAQHVTEAAEAAGAAEDDGHPHRGGRKRGAKSGEEADEKGG